MAINTNKQETLRLLEGLNNLDFEKIPEKKQDNKKYQKAWEWPLVYGEREI